MIINELSNLFGRLVEQGIDLPRLGWSKQEISFRLVIDLKGNLVRIEDARTQEVKRTPSSVLVPRKSGRTSGITPFFLCDNLKYLLGYGDEKSKGLLCFEELKKKHLLYEDEISSSEYSAVCRFLEKWEPSKCADVFREHGFNIDEFNNGVFRIQKIDENHDVHWDKTISSWWDNEGADKWSNSKKDLKKEYGICLVTGKNAIIARLHKPQIKKWNHKLQKVDPMLVSFNHDSFESYGRKQGSNAPISVQAVHAYCNALNWLITDNRHHVELADSMVLFWTDAPKREDDDEFALFTRGSIIPASLDAQDNGLVKNVADRMRKIAQGRPVLSPEDETKWAKTGFYILGLSPNNGRLSVRFFHRSSMKEWHDRLASHYLAMQLEPRKGFNDPEIISPAIILRETVFQKEMDRVSPLSGGTLMRSILQGLPYPDSIAMDIMRRCRTDGEINYIRCAYLKAWLTRKRKDHPYKLTPMLDETNTQPGYVLGRLLAVLDKTQCDAINPQRTIKDAYYGSASASPRSVFPRLMRMYRHHVNALKEFKVVREKQVQQIMSLLDGNIPAHLNPEQQGLFALGFYHQMQALFPTKNND